MEFLSFPQNLSIYICTKLQNTVPKRTLKPTKALGHQSPGEAMVVLWSVDILECSTATCSTRVRTNLFLQPAEEFTEGNGILNLCKQQRVRWPESPALRHPSRTAPQGQRTQQHSGFHSVDTLLEAFCGPSHYREGKWAAQLLINWGSQEGPDLNTQAAPLTSEFHPTRARTTG